MSIPGFFYSRLARLREEGWQTDVQLKGGNSVPGATISAHKLILAARSNVFKKMLEQDECKASSDEEIITLSEMKYEEVKALVHFFYTFDISLYGVISIEKHAWSLYLAADKYEIPDLRIQSRRALMSSLNVTTVLDVLELAQIPFDRALNDAALKYIKKNISVIASSNELKSFAVRNPDLIVKILKFCLNQS